MFYFHKYILSDIKKTIFAFQLVFSHSKEKAIS